MPEANRALPCATTFGYTCAPMADWRPFEGEWGVVLGASSGFGAATARALGRHGMSIVGVHLDRKATLPLAEAVADDVRAAGAEAHFFNVNAADPEKRAQVCDRAPRS